MKSISEWSMIDHHVKWASFMIIIKIVVLITLCQGLYGMKALVGCLNGRKELLWNQIGIVRGGWLSYTGSGWVVRGSEL
mgnify:CR=1 FL=1